MQENFSVSNVAASALDSAAIFRISPLIRLTLLSLYIALTLPLPFLSQVTGTPIPPLFLWLGLGFGFLALYAALSERVVLDEQGIHVTYPKWVPRLFRKGWFLPWAEVQALKPRTTGQGGLVYYFLSKSGEGYLLPMRVAGFARLVNLVQAKTGIDTSDVRPLAQPWMYLILLAFTLLLLLTDSWVISTVFVGSAITN
ncbi:MAG: hypothetical protein N3E45_13935 [Oscillatoriaceae bacterium SKW80]|nr:hypothetical protein [Oscillatoriaceae bacterium SKYG93]MCX8121900.1 hypothetical protein [Oscillatoriaceae bacterium SKW80]MDW8454661.1 hypothetical protein [Oscillatoriaceae cyanobacterium SKYGB_i_bin93]HIK28634.1 hypothetical protein [Oscillatoriaceae cyanobacterium M7585_C2015_266]